jgi:hypothetical protein
MFNWLSYKGDLQSSLAMTVASSFPRSTMLSGLLRRSLRCLGRAAQARPEAIPAKTGKPAH